MEATRLLAGTWASRQLTGTIGAGEALIVLVEMATPGRLVELTPDVGMGKGFIGNRDAERVTQRLPAVARLPLEQPAGRSRLANALEMS